VNSSEAGERKRHLSQSAQRTQRINIFFIAGEGPAIKKKSAASRKKTPPEARAVSKNRPLTDFLKKESSFSVISAGLSEAGERKEFYL
jgi:hypothetical protein